MCCGTHTNCWQGGGAREQCVRAERVKDGGWAALDPRKDSPVARFPQLWAGLSLCPGWRNRPRLPRPTVGGAGIQPSPPGQGCRGRRGGGKEHWAGRDPRRPTGHASPGAGMELGRLKEAGAKLQPLPLSSQPSLPQKGGPGCVPDPQPRPQALLPQAWPGPTGPTRRPGSFLEGTRVLEKVRNSRRCMVLFSFGLQVLIFFY